MNFSDPHVFPLDHDLILLELGFKKFIWRASKSTSRAPPIEVEREEGKKG
jgi:hypothetical protein